MKTGLSDSLPASLSEALKQIGEQEILVDGKPVKAGNCYYVGEHPPHVLYNTNCPDELKERINSLLKLYKYAP